MKYELEGVEAGGQQHGQEIIAIGQMRKAGSQGAAVVMERSEGWRDVTKIECIRRTGWRRGGRRRRLG